VESAATQTNYPVEPDPVKEPETQGTTINPSPYVRKVVERMAKLSLEAVEQVFDTELGYMNENTGQIFYSFEDFLQSLPSWEEFFSSKQWTYENVNHLLKQAGFRGRLSSDMFTITLPRDASEKEVTKFLNDVYVKGMNLVKLSYDVQSAWMVPQYHVGRFIASRTADAAGIDSSVAQAFIDPRDTLQNIAIGGLNRVCKMLSIV
jgi:hypothetical protein